MSGPESSKSIFEGLPPILVEYAGAAALKAADINFQTAPDGSIGVRAIDLYRLAESLPVSAVVWFASAAEHEEQLDPLSFFDGRLVLDRMDQVLIIDGQPTKLGVQYGLLEFFMLNSPRVISRSDLYKHLWGGSEERYQLLSLRVTKCRNLLGEKYRDAIVTERGGGYAFRPHKTSKGLYIRPASRGDDQNE